MPLHSDQPLGSSGADVTAWRGHDDVTSRGSSDVITHACGACCRDDVTGHHSDVIAHARACGAAAAGAGAAARVVPRAAGPAGRDQLQWTELEGAEGWFRIPTIMLKK